MNRTTIIAAWLAVVLAIPTHALAGPAAETAVRLEVDVSALPKTDFPENTRRWIVDNQTAVLEREGFVVKGDASRVMRIEVSRYGDDGIHMKARLMIVGDPGSVREFDCEACLNSQFLKKVDAETATLAVELRRELEEPVVEEPAEPGSELQPAAADEGTDAPVEHAVSDAPADHDGKRLGVAGYAGIGALALGLGVTLGGVIVLADGATVRLQHRNDDIEEVTDRVPLGAGLTGAGVALLVAGAVLVAVDQTVLRKRRARRAETAFVPVVSPTGVGVTWSARF